MWCALRAIAAIGSFSAVNRAYRGLCGLYQGQWHYGGVCDVRWPVGSEAGQWDPTFFRHTSHTPPCCRWGRCCTQRLLGMLLRSHCAWSILQKQTHPPGVCV